MFELGIQCILQKRQKHLQAGTSHPRGITNVSGIEIEQLHVSKNRVVPKYKQFKPGDLSYK